MAHRLFNLKENRSISLSLFHNLKHWKKQSNSLKSSQSKSVQAAASSPLFTERFFTAAAATAKRHLLLESVRSYFVSFFADQTRAQIGRVRGKNPLAAAAAPRKRPVIFARFQACLHPFLQQWGSSVRKTPAVPRQATLHRKGPRSAS